MAKLPRQLKKHFQKSWSCSPRPVDPADCQLTVGLSATRLFEGDRLIVSVTLVSPMATPFLELLLLVPPNFVLSTGRNRIVLSVAPGEEVKRTFELRSVARGRSHLGFVYLRMSDRSGLCSREIRLGTSSEVHTYPIIPRIHQLPRPLQTGASFGNYVAPRFGEGIEPGEVRPFVPGDRTQHINWPASLRSGRLYVRQFQEERNADVVLLLDTTADTGTHPGSSLDMCVRAAGALAAAYLARKDRVGLIEYGGYLRWIRPASGRRHLESLLAAVVPADVTFSYVVRDLDFLPRQVLPPQALIIAISSLLDDRFIRVIANLRDRGFDLAVLAISPVASTCQAIRGSQLTDLACRLWALEWQSQLEELRRRGLVLIEWQAQTPLEAALASLSRHLPRRELRS
jgi:uncharacterized protein (DUF58 family)